MKIHFAVKSKNTAHERARMCNPYDDAPYLDFGLTRDIVTCRSCLRIHKARMLSTTGLSRG